MRLVSLLGLVTMLLLAWLMSDNRRRMNWRLIFSGIGLQLVIGVTLLSFPPGRAAFQHVSDGVQHVIDCSEAGAHFVFGSPLPEYKSKDPVMAARFAFSVLPMVVFVSSLMAVLFYVGVLQLLVKAMARIMVWVMDVSGAESLSAAANVFIGMTTAPLAVKPYLPTMTRSEIMAMMTSGMATVSVSIIGAYVIAGPNWKIC